MNADGPPVPTHKQVCYNTYILLGVLVCSITGYFYELCRILTSPLGE